MTVSSPSNLATSNIYDVIIIGAGPCGLATAARLRESHPSALFTSEEQARYAWIKRNSQRTSIKNNKNGKVKPTSNFNNSDIDMLVLDATGTQWMERWNSLFKKLEIEYLRSPMFFHPDPQDRDALLAHCHRCGGDGACIEEIAGCVGKEVSKHKKKCRANGKMYPAEINERDRHDYFAPSAEAFARFCEDCVERYGLRDVIRKDVVETLDYDFVPSTGLEQDKLFTIHTMNTAYLARTVVLATGGGTLTIPAPFPQQPHQGFTHALDSTADHELLPQRLRHRIQAHRATTVLVIGGGLTSIQVVERLLHSGADKVYLSLRGPLKIKPFDVGLAWIGKWRNQQKAAFWTSDDMLERLEMAKMARGGGSVTPRFATKLRAWTTEKRLEMYTHTKVVGQVWLEESKKWVVETEPVIEAMPNIDHIVFATGLSSDIETMPILQKINDKYRIKSFGGFPALTDDLMWSNDVPLFLIGKMAMLQVGPGSANLEGARLGAERVAWGIMNVLDEVPKDEETDRCGERRCAEDFHGHDNYMRGVGSKFAILATCH